MDLLEIQGTTAIWQQKRYDCVLGRSGTSTERSEGDGTTPIGIWPVRQLYYRPDRLRLIETRLPLKALTATDGWCDSPEDPQYNQYVRMPYPSSCEALWRTDHLYDLIFELGYNDDPVVPHLGSVIFMHVAADDFSPTEGCIALRLDDLLQIAGDCGPDLSIQVLE